MAHLIWTVQQKYSPIKKESKNFLLCHFQTLLSDHGSDPLNYGDSLLNAQMMDSGVRRNDEVEDVSE